MQMGASTVAGVTGPIGLNVLPHVAMVHNIEDAHATIQHQKREATIVLQTEPVPKRHNHARLLQTAQVRFSSFQKYCLYRS